MKLLPTLLATLALALALTPAAGAVTGQQRVLLMQVTWGPEPWPAAHGQASLDEAAAFIRSASFGRTWIDGQATPWLRALPAPPPVRRHAQGRRVHDAARARLSRRGGVAARRMTVPP